MEVNNFSQIERILHFSEDGDTYYFVTILQRKKDFPENSDITDDRRLIKSYYIRSLEHLEKRKAEMIALSKLFNARVYINPTPCSYRKAVLKSFDELSNMLLNNNCKAFPSLPSSISGKYNADGEKIWVVDLDNTTEAEVGSIVDDLNSVRPLGTDKLVAIIPTKSGVHLLTHPFDVSAFLELHLVDIHKNNPTLLYYSWE